MTRKIHSQRKKNKKEEHKGRIAGREKSKRKRRKRRKHRIERVKRQKVRMGERGDGKGIERSGWKLRMNICTIAQGKLHEERRERKREMYQSCS